MKKLICIALFAIISLAQQLSAEEVTVFIIKPNSPEPLVHSQFSYIGVVQPSDLPEVQDISLRNQIEHPRRRIIQIRSQESIITNDSEQGGVFYLLWSRGAGEHYEIIRELRLGKPKDKIDVVVHENKLNVSLRFSDPLVDTIIDKTAFQKKLMGGYLKFSSEEDGSVKFKGFFKSTTFDDNNLLVDSSISYISPGSYLCEAVFFLGENGRHSQLEQFKIETVVGFTEDSLNAGRAVKSTHEPNRIEYRKTTNLQN